VMELTMWCRKRRDYFDQRDERQLEILFWKILVLVTRLGEGQALAKSASLSACFSLLYHQEHQMHSLPQFLNIGNKSNHNLPLTCSSRGILYRFCCEYRCFRIFRTYKNRPPKFCVSPPLFF